MWCLFFKTVLVYYLFLQDNTRNKLPAFGGVFGAGFFFTVASPGQKKKKVNSKVSFGRYQLNCKAYIHSYALLAAENLIYSFGMLNTRIKNTFKNHFYYPE